MRVVREVLSRRRRPAEEAREAAREEELPFVAVAWAWAWWWRRSWISSLLRPSWVSGTVLPDVDIIVGGQ